MAAPPSTYKDRQFIAVIGDEVGEVDFIDRGYEEGVRLTQDQDSVTGLLLAGIGVGLLSVYDNCILTRYPACHFTTGCAEELPGCR